MNGITREDKICKNRLGQHEHVSRREVTGAVRLIKRKCMQKEKEEQEDRKKMVGCDEKKH